MSKHVTWTGGTCQFKYQVVMITILSSCRQGQIKQERGVSWSVSSHREHFYFYEPIHYESFSASNFDFFIFCNLKQRQSLSSGVQIYALLVQREIIVITIINRKPAYVSSFPTVTANILFISVTLIITMLHKLLKMVPFAQCNTL